MYTLSGEFYMSRFVRFFEGSSSKDKHPDVLLGMPFLIENETMKRKRTNANIQKE